MVVKGGGGLMVKGGLMVGGGVDLDIPVCGHCAAKGVGFSSVELVKRVCLV